MLANQSEVLRTAWFLVGDGHRAEELAQHALVRTCAAWPRARQDPLAYTRRVMVNLRTDTWRRRRREVLVPIEDLSVYAATEDRRVETHDELSRLLSLLTARQRRVVVLRYLLDLPEAEVAVDLNVSVGTVKSTASRALDMLRRSIENGTHRAVMKSGDGNDYAH